MYQYEAVVLGGHGWAPSNIVHRDAATGGRTHLSPPHPPPTIEAAQNRLVFTQVSGLSVGVPDGTHPPASDTTNALACTP